METGNYVTRSNGMHNDLPFRIIARLDVKTGHVIKGVQLEGLRKVGIPEIMAKHYYEHGADELLFMDAVASLYDRNHLASLLETTAHDVFIPLSVGGGVRSIEDAKHLFGSGADKICVNTAAIARPSFITDLAREFGSQSVVASIEAKKLESADGWEALYKCGREKADLEVLRWAKDLAELGAGELLVTSIDREGTRQGFDLELYSSLRECVDIPIIASGGMGNIDHIASLYETGVDAVAIADHLHFGRSKVSELKGALISKGIPVRLSV
jgi:cyclase